MTITYHDLQTLNLITVPINSKHLYSLAFILSDSAEDVKFFDVYEETARKGCIITKHKISSYLLTADTVWKMILHETHADQIVSLTTCQFPMSLIWKVEDTLYRYPVDYLATCKDGEVRGACLYNGRYVLPELMTDVELSKFYSMRSQNFEYLGMYETASILDNCSTFDSVDPIIFN